MAAAVEILEAKGADRPPAIKVAQYVRMSTDHQRYSTENQADAIAAYAALHGMEIVQTYADEGKSGLNIGGRDALKQLIDDIDGGRARFEALLVYDVSRWGRFQDADESAFYEYQCRRAGVRVIYCAEQFENDGTPVATIVKSVKRAMAGEYSRELSSKVFAGQCRLIQLGYRQGGPAGIGLRRVLVDERGESKGALSRGEHKSLQTDRVILVPGPPEETDLVRRIYRLFLITGMTEGAIALLLNSEGSLTDLGRPWTRATVHQVLTNEKYVGNNVFNRVSYKLKQRRVRNPPEMWVRADGVFEPIVGHEDFQKAREIILARSRRFSDEELLEQLRSLLDRHGAISGLIIDERADMPSSSAYRSRFGSLLRAYALIGYRPNRDYRYLQINQRLRQLHPEILRDIHAGIAQMGGTTASSDETGLVTINSELTVSVAIARCHETSGGAYRWRFAFENLLLPDITVAVRMDGSNQKPHDYFLFPSLDLEGGRLRLAEENGLSIDAYRFEDLGELFELAHRIPFARAA